MVIADLFIRHTHAIAQNVHSCRPMCTMQRAFTTTRQRKDAHTYTRTWVLDRFKFVSFVMLPISGGIPENYTKQGVGTRIVNGIKQQFDLVSPVQDHQP